MVIRFILVNSMINEPNREENHRWIELPSAVTFEHNDTPSLLRERNATFLKELDRLVAGNTQTNIYVWLPYAGSQREFDTRVQAITSYD